MPRLFQKFQVNIEPNGSSPFCGDDYLLKRPPDQKFWTNVIVQSFRRQILSAKFNEEQPGLPTFQLQNGATDVD